MDNERRLMTGIDSILYNDNIQEKGVAFDLDGTLLSGDLGETVFYLTILMQGLGMASSDFPALVSTVKTSTEFYCPENADLPKVMGQYTTLIRQGQLQQAYSLTAEYLAHFKKEEVCAFSEAVLSQEIPCQQLRLTLGAETFALTLQAKTDPLLTSIIQYCYQQGARVLIISGSPQAIVEGYCLFQNLPTGIARGIQWDEKHRCVIPYGKAKLDILRQEGITQPYIAFGNATGDLEMLSAAVYPFVRKTSQQSILDQAAANHWNII